MNTRLKELFTLYTEGKTSDDQKQELFRLVLQEENQSALKELVDALLAGGKVTETIADAQFDAILNIITAAAPPPPAAERKAPAGRLALLRRPWAAAAVAFMLIAGAYWLISRDGSLTQTPAHTTAPQSSTAEIAPGRNGAILTLADGSELVLDDREKGLVATQNGAAVSLKGGRLAYDITGLPAAATA